MNNGSIPKQVLKAIGQIGTETVEQGIKEAARIGDSIITGKELLGNITPMSDEEMRRKQAEDEKKKQEETERLRREMGQGRNVGAEIKQVSDQKKQEEEEKEKQFLQKIKEQREAEEQERKALAEQYGGEKKRPKGPQRLGKIKTSADQSVELAKKPD